MSDLVGQILCERYQVKSLIGRGGMADVYLVLDRERAVDLAMKLLREDLAQDRVFLRRFKREAHNLARLQHPNIVRFYGLEQEGAQAFILLEYVDGSPLRREIFDLDGKPMSPTRILEIVRPICSALHFAHRKGIVHCDLKPGNVMVHRSGMVLLTDFGVARMMDTATVTLLGVGTPAYMAPEIIAGKEPSPATDIYAMGVILFEMLTGGERPFTGDQASITGSTSEKVRWEHLNITPPSPRKRNPDVPQQLERLVLRCLAKEPGKRFSSAMDLLQALELALAEDAAGRVAKPAEIPAKAGIVTVEEVREVPKMSAQVSMEAESKPPELLDVERIPPRVVSWRGKLQPLRKPRHFLVVLTIVSLSITIAILFGGRTTLPPPPTNLPLAETVARIGTEAVVIVEVPSSATDTTYTSTPTPISSPTVFVSATETSHPNPSDVDGIVRSNIDGMELVLIPKGEFTIGNLEYTGVYYDQPPHVVFLDAYWIDRTEVTNDMFASFLNDQGNYDNAGHRLFEDLQPALVYLDMYVSMIYSDDSGNWLPAEGYEDFPVTNVSWYGANSYCEWAGRRLPTEAEWEKAARGIYGWKYPWGDEEPNCEIANLNFCVGGLVEAGSFSKDISPFGLYNMAGNVAEWTSTWISEIYVDELPEVNPQGPSEGGHKVVKGGAWYPDVHQSDGNGRVDARYGVPPGYFIESVIGFRCAMDIQS